MRGSVTSKCMRGHRKTDKRCGSRCLRWYYILEAPPGPDGKRRRRWSTGHPTRKAAETALRQELARRDQGVMLAHGKLTLAGFTARFLDHLATVRDPRTVERYEELLRLHVLPTLGGLQLRDLQPAHLTELYARLLREGRRDGRPGGLSAQTVHHVHRALHRALRQAVRWELLARNPAADLELPPVERAPMVTLDQDQAARLLEATEGSWMRMLVLLGLALGARLGELLALRWSDLDLEQGTARIQRSVQLVEGRLRFKPPKTAAGARPVGLDPPVVAALRKHRAEQVELRLAYAHDYRADLDLVLCKANGEPYRPDSVSTMFRLLARRAGLPEGVHVHTLRHSAASFLAAAGVPASDIAAQLGHADGGALALRVYVHPLEENRRRAAAVLGRVVGEATQRGSAPKR